MVVLPWAIVTLCSTGELLANEIVTAPAFACSCLVLYSSWPPVLASRLRAVGLGAAGAAGLAAVFVAPLLGFAGAVAVLVVVLVAGAASVLVAGAGCAGVDAEVAA